MTGKKSPKVKRQGSPRRLRRSSPDGTPLEEGSREQRENPPERQTHTQEELEEVFGPDSEEGEEAPSAQDLEEEAGAQPEQQAITDQQEPHSVGRVEEDELDELDFPLRLDGDRVLLPSTKVEAIARAQLY